MKLLTLPVLTLSLALSSLAHADNLGNRAGSIEIGVNDQLNCNHIEKGTRVTCDPYKRRRHFEDAWGPSDLVIELKPFESQRCNSDRAGAYLFKCVIPQGWVDPNPQPLPMPEPVPNRPLDPREQWLQQTHNQTAELFGLTASALSGARGPLIRPDALRQIGSYAERFRQAISRLVFVPPSTCQSQCSDLQRASETISGVADAFRATDPLAFNDNELASLKGQAQAAYELTKQADAPPAMVATDVCGKMLFGEGAGGNLFRVTSFTMRNTITQSSPNAAYVRVEFMTSGAKPLEQSDDGDCRKEKPGLWVLRVPFQGKELRVEMREANVESKSVSVTATHGGTPIKIRQ